MCISQNMDHICQCINVFIEIYSFILKLLRKIKILTSIKGNNWKVRENFMY